MSCCECETKPKTYEERQVEAKERAVNDRQYELDSLLTAAATLVRVSMNLHKKLPISAALIPY